jgi:hypothetical protein
MDRSYHRAAYEHHRAKAAAYRSKAEGHLARASAHHSRLGFGAKTYGAQITERPAVRWSCPCECESKEEHSKVEAALAKARAEAQKKLDEINRTKPDSASPTLSEWRPTY